MSLPVVTVEQVRQWERATWEAGGSQAEVISNAGRRVALRALEMTGVGDAVIVLAGLGHNGDDARAAIQHLAGRKVLLLNIRDPGTEGRELDTLLRREASLIIDGIFGVGLNRPLNEEWSGVIERINESGVPVLAVDVPSGLNADSGRPQNTAVKASVTLTMGAPKRGMLAREAWPFVGRLEVASDIGLSAPFPESDWRWTMASEFKRFPPIRREAGTHKGSFGHAVLLCGSLGYHGAAVLAARGALCARPGLVTVVTREETYLPVAAQCQAAMVHPWADGLELPGTASAILAGPGLAARDLPKECGRTIGGLWQESALPMIADASALEWLPAGGAAAAVRVVTPHPGEAGRLLGISSGDVQSDRPSAVRRISERFGNCWVVLKGHQTLIGKTSGPLWVNSSGNAYLAQGGSGDVLAGFVAGLLAQEALWRDPLFLLRYAVWRHGAAADQLMAEKPGWTVEDLPGRLGGAVRGENDSRTGGDE